MTHYIRAKHPEYAPRGETVDETDSRKDARYLVQEYQMAYGYDGWTVYSVTRKPSDWS